MGNAHSDLTVPRDQNRLSKPKTFPAADSTLSLSSALNPARFSSHSVLTLRPEPGQFKDSAATLRRVRSEGRQRLNSHIVQPKSCLSEGDMSSSGAQDELRDLPQLDRRVSASLSPRSSLTSQVSLGVDPRNVDLNTAVMILEELRKTASPEDLVTLHKALQPTRPSDVPSVDDVDPATTSLIRRRSFATPGVATRKKSQSLLVDRLSSTHQQQKSWRREIMGASPLSKLEGLGSQAIPRSEEVLPISSLQPRAETPGDLDYSHLGSFTLGSLVITNGMASPALSTREQSVPRSSVDFRREEEYFTADEGSGSSQEECSDASDPTIKRADPDWSKAHPKLARQSGRSCLRSCARPKSSSQSKQGGPLRRDLADNNVDIQEEQNLYDDSLDHSYLPNGAIHEHNVESLEIDEGFADAEPDADVWDLRDGSAVVDSRVDMANAPFEALRSHPPGCHGAAPLRNLGKHVRPLPTSKVDSGYSSGVSVFENEERRDEGSVESNLSNSGFKASPQSSPTMLYAMSESQVDPQSLPGTMCPVRPEHLPTQNAFRPPSRMSSTPTSPRAQARSSKSWRFSVRLPRFLSSKSNFPALPTPSGPSPSQTRAPRKLQKKWRNSTMPNVTVIDGLEETKGRDHLGVKEVVVRARTVQCNEDLESSRPALSNVSTVKSRPWSHFSRPKSVHGSDKRQVRGRDGLPANDEVPAHRRSLSLSRISHKVRSGVTRARDSSDDSDEDETFVPFAIEVFGSASYLGSSPYDVALIPQQPNALGHSSQAPPARPASRRFRTDSWKGQVAPSMQPTAPPNFRPYLGRRRPKSYHGRGHKAMEVLGEEDDDGHAEHNTPSVRDGVMQPLSLKDSVLGYRVYSTRHGTAPSNSLVRPKSMGNDRRTWRSEVPPVPRLSGSFSRGPRPLSAIPGIGT